MLGAIGVQLLREFLDLFVLEGGEEDPKLCVAVDVYLFVDADLSQFQVVQQSQERQFLEGSHCDPVHVVCDAGEAVLDEADASGLLHGGL